VTQCLRDVAAAVPSGPIQVLGPAPCPITRINRQFRYQVLVKAPKARGIMDLFDRVRDSLTPGNDDLAIAVDIDPTSTL